MKIKLITEIARALLMSRWRQTLVAAFGVCFSIMMFVSLLGFMSGLNDMLDGLILNRSPHVHLFNEIRASKMQPIEKTGKDRQEHHIIHSVKPGVLRQELYNVSAIMQTLKQDPDVLGISPKISAQVFFHIGSVDMAGVINGIDVEAESRYFMFEDYVIAGNPTDLKNVPNSIILGKGAADKMLAKPGDVIYVSSVAGERIPLKVAGYFQSGISDVDKVQSYASLATTQKLLGKPEHYITDLHIKLKDISKAPALARVYADLFGADAEDVQTANAQFETGSSVRSIISYAVGITLLVVAGFGIYNILNMMIYEKMDSIAILKATGFSGRDVRSVFLGIALSIGIAGGIAGLVLGFSLSALIDSIPFNTASLPTIKTYPINYNPKFYLIGWVFSLLTTLLAGILPARKASRIDPVIIIRGK